jgi:hypothetical protein
MNPTLSEFLAWLEQGPYAIPTLPNQADLQPNELALPADNNPGDRFTIEFSPDEGSIQSVTGGAVTFDVSDAGQTWYRFFGLLQTSARSLGFHGVGLPQPHTHRMPGAYTLPPQLLGPANLHAWLDCPNTVACPFIAAAIRAFLLVTMQRTHAIYPWI